MTIEPDCLSQSGRVALVTGAAAGIGEAIATSLAGFGAHLALCDREGDGLGRVAEALRQSGRRIFTAVLDVRDAEAVDDFTRRAAAELGPFHVLVNNAGGTFHALFGDLSPKGEQALVDENFRSVTSCVRSALPHLADGASIVNVTSIEAHRAGPGYAVYAAMKAAVENLSKSLALELGARGIRVNCVAPDAVPTPGTGAMQISTPLGRLGDVDDVAGAVLYLASDLSRFVTGTTIHVDGGTRAAGGWRRGPDGTFLL